MLTKPYPYQVRGIKKIFQCQGRVLLADDMGLGKSYQSLKYADLAEAFPLIIVCPAFLKWNWQNEVKLHLGLQAQVLQGRKPVKRELMRSSIIIINYEILGCWLKYLRRLNPKLVILDECHFIRNRSAKRTKYSKALCQGVQQIIAISGYPLESSPVELFPTLNILKPDQFDSFSDYAFEYCAPEYTRWGWSFRGAENLDDLHRRLKPFMIRRMKSEVLKELPPKRQNVVLVNLTKTDQKEYQTASQDLIKWLKRTSPSKASKARKAERLVRMGYLKRLAAVLKFQHLTDWIDNYLQSTDDKLVVFVEQKAIVRDLVKKYGKICVKVDGTVTGNKREMNIRAFQKRKAIRLMIGNIKACGVGVNLTAAPAALVAELPWTPGALRQLVDRLHRIGQTRVVDIYFLVAKDTVEQRICSILQSRQGTLDKVLDGKAKTMDSLRIYDLLEQELTDAT